MKHFPTIENKMMHIAETLACHQAKDSHLPGKHVISNILNYARSLEVLKLRNGNPVMLTGN